MRDEEILHIFVEIACDRGRHGDFLTAFGEAVMRADPSNFALVRPIAVLLIAKYRLGKYFDNFSVTHEAQR